MPGRRLQYRVEDGILVLTAAALPSHTDHPASFDQIRADRQVPDRSLVLIDTRSIDVRTGLEGERRLSGLLKGVLPGLGPKMGPRCAIVTSGANPIALRLFQASAKQRGVVVGFFHDPTAARLWLSQETGYMFD